MACLYAGFIGVALAQVPATTAPLRDVPAGVRTQPLASGAVTHAVTLPPVAGESTVTVRSVQPDSVVGQYRFRFESLDLDGDGFISREEAQANPALADEFQSLDTARRGRLDRSQLQGWLVP
ncbi:EF-hand domain-containing protein [Stenotrophomonas sp. 278]|uniref:EF-hand domain-containing protein n=1 Tax=Stenotrophomonas sp. 278 TaxID=2479851 RepID=UPI0028A1E87B|nr:EF-hand domain-containing protein [Stenotrophomonas sp. 278]